jgi:hypothetical protein
VSFDRAWPERLTIELEGVRIPVIGRAHLIENKQALGRSQDKADIERLRQEEPERLRACSAP